MRGLRLAIAAVLIVGSGSARAFVFTGSGTGFSSAHGPTYACLPFSAHRRHSSPQRHGMLCGLRGVRPKGTGPSLTIVFTRQGTVACVAKSSLGPQDGLCTELSGGCGAGSTRVCGSSGGVGAGIADGASVSTTEEIPPAVGPRVGRVVRNGKLSCTVISNAVMLQYDPSAIGQDIVACGAAGSTDIDITVFTNGYAQFGCGTDIDPATGCVSAAHLDSCRVPVPICR